MRLIALGAAGLVAGVVAGVAVPALAEWTESGSTVVAATSTGLAEPSATVTVDGTTATVTVVAAGSGAPPAWYEVRRDGTVVCTSQPPDGQALPGACGGLAAPAASSLTYAVAAVRGSWNAITEVQVVTPPPTPLLELLDPEDGPWDDGVPGDRVTSLDAVTLLLTAPATVNDYELTVSLDDVNVFDGPITSAGPSDYELVLDDLGAGPRTVTAIATYEGVSSTASLEFTVASDTRVESVVLADVPGGSLDNNRKGDLTDGDTMTVTFGRAIDPSSVCVGWDPAQPLPVTVTVDRIPRPKPGTSILTVAPLPDACGPSVGLHVGSLTVDRRGRNDNPTERLFSLSTLAMSADRKSLTVTIDAGDPTFRYRLPDEYSATFSPAAGLLDELGFPVVADFVTTTTTF